MPGLVNLGNTCFIASVLQASALCCGADEGAPLLTPHARAGRHLRARRPFRSACSRSWSCDRQTPWGPWWVRCC